MSESRRVEPEFNPRLRIQAPNSTRRRTAVIALDAVAKTTVLRLAAQDRPQTTFLIAGQVDREPDAADGLTIWDLSGRRRTLDEEIDASDLIVLVAGPGGEANAASLVGQACRRHRVMSTGFIVGTTDGAQSALSKTLAQLRPWSLMTVVAESDDYIDEMLTALRA
jgi:hypothetical protein